MKDLNAAFSAGSGGLSIKGFMMLNIGLFSMLIFLMAGWILISAWRGWANRQAGSEDFGYLFIRLIILISLALIFYTSKQ